MTEIFERIKKLAEMVCFDLTQGSEQYAAFKAYAKGLSLVFDDYNVLERDLFPSTAEGEALALFCNQFKVSGSLDKEKRRQIICDKFKNKYGDFDEFGFYYALESIGSSCSFGSERVEISNIEDKPLLLDRLGRILDTYQSPMTKIIVSGPSMKFDAWDNTPYTFDGFDRLGLAFYILDDF